MQLHIDESYKIDYASLGVRGQSCPDVSKEDFKTLISQKLMEV